jgi:hypothetical protein
MPNARLPTPNFQNAPVALGVGTWRLGVYEMPEGRLELPTPRL